MHRDATLQKTTLDDGVRIHIVRTLLARGPQPWLCPLSAPSLRFTNWRFQPWEPLSWRSQGTNDCWMRPDHLSRAHTCSGSATRLMIRPATILQYNTAAALAKDASQVAAHLGRVGKALTHLPSAVFTAQPSGRWPNWSRHCLAGIVLASLANAFACIPTTPPTWLARPLATGIGENRIRDAKPRGLPGGVDIHLYAA